MFYHKWVFVLIQLQPVLKRVSHLTDHDPVVIVTVIARVTNKRDGIFVDKRAESEFKVGRDVSHRRCQGNAQLFNVLLVVDHGTWQIHQKVQIQRIIFGRSELYGDVVPFACNSNELIQRSKMTTLSYRCANFSAKPFEVSVDLGCWRHWIRAISGPQWLGILAVGRRWTRPGSCSRYSSADNEETAVTSRRRPGCQSTNFIYRKWRQVS